MNKTVLGGLAAVLALAAIFYFNQPHDAPPVITPAPAPVVTKADTVVIKPTVKPIPKPEIKIEPKPVAPAPKVTFYRVEQEGKQGPAVECSEVKPFADGKSPAELAILAKQYGVSESTLKRYYVCIN